MLRFDLSLIVLMGAVVAFAQDATEPVTTDRIQQLRAEAAHRQRRIIFDNDGNEVVYYCEQATAKEFLDKRTTNLAGTQVDTIVYCTFSSGFSMFTHRTKVGEVFTTMAEGFSRNKTKAFIDQGTDPLEIVVDFCRDNDIEVLWSMRMNDIHDSWNAWYSPYLFPQLKKDHPEYLLGDKQTRTVNGRWSGVDYARPEIRDLAFQFIQEVCQDYDVDGVLMDFFRHPAYFRSHVQGGVATQENLDAMTDLVRRIRTMADAEALKKGHPILVTMRVPDSVEYCKAIGLDIERWLDERLIDWFSGSGYFRLNPWETTVSLAHKYNVPFYASLDETRLRDDAAKNLRGSLESYRARAEEVWQSGADGIYMFNFFDPNSPLWRELGSLDTLQGLNKTYTTGARGVYDLRNIWFKGGDRFVRRTLVSPESPRTIAPAQPCEVEIVVGQLPLPRDGAAPKMTLVVHTKETAAESGLAARLNGVELSNEVEQDNLLRLPVPIDLVHAGANRIEVTSTNAAPVELLDVYLELTYPGE
jgi:hypothetical protein